MKALKAEVNKFTKIVDNLVKKLSEIEKEKLILRNLKTVIAKVKTIQL